MLATCNAMKYREETAFCDGKCLKWNSLIRLFHYSVFQVLHIEHGKKGTVTLESVDVKATRSSQQLISVSGLQSDEKAESALLVKAADNNLLGDETPTKEETDPLELGTSSSDQLPDEDTPEAQLCATRFWEI